MTDECVAEFVYTPIDKQTADRKAARAKNIDNFKRFTDSMRVKYGLHILKLLNKSRQGQDSQHV
ncbi:MAG: hypothetical protein ACK521_00845 [bacterium]